MTHNCNLCQPPCCLAPHLESSSTTQLPLPTFSRGPLDPGCEDEDAIVCHNGHIKGQQGVALDDLVYIMTRMARQMEAEGVSAGRRPRLFGRGF